MNHPTHPEEQVFGGMVRGREVVAVEPSAVPPPTLATGAPLTPASWADFVTRLHHDCVGEGVADHCTRDALFIVQAKRIITGFDTDYTDQLLVDCDDSSWYSPQEYWDGCDEYERAVLNVAAQAEYEHDFLALDVSEQWEILGALPDHHVTGWHEEWEYVNSHFTKDAAEAFIKRKKHDYREGMRVCVESQYYAWEFNAVKEAILSGRLSLDAQAALAAPVAAQKISAWLHTGDLGKCWATIGPSGSSNPEALYLYPAVPVTDAEVLAAGYALSNIVFNLAQHAGEPLTSDWVSSLDAARKRWDAAVVAAGRASRGQA